MKTDNEFAPHVQEIAQVLEDRVEYDIAEIETDFNKYTGILSLPVEDAKRCIINNYLKDAKPQNRSLGELLPNENSVKLFCQIAAINPKDVKVNGSTKRIYYGLLSDRSGTLPFTAWLDFKLKKGDTIRIKDAYTKDWQGSPEIHLGDRARVAKTSEELEVSSKPLYKSQSKFNGVAKEYTVLDFRDGQSNVSTQVRILSIEPREITVKGDKKTIFTGTAADATGKCRFTAWHDLGLQPGDVVKLSGGYIKSWRGLPELQIDDQTKLERLSDDTLPSLSELDIDKKLIIGKLTELGGITGAAVEGMVLDLKKGSGLIYRCSECKRVLQKKVCMVHGKQEGVVDLRIKAVIDDGTGTMSVVLDKNGTEKVLAKNISECEELIYKTRNLDAITDELVTKLIAQPVRVHGNVITDDYGLMMICNEIELIEIDIKTEATKLLDSLASEGGLGYANYT